MASLSVLSLPASSPSPDRQDARRPRSRNPSTWSVEDVVWFVKDADPQALGPHVELFRKHVCTGWAWWAGGEIQGAVAWGVGAVCTMSWGHHSREAGWNYRFLRQNNHLVFCFVLFIYFPLYSMGAKLHIHVCILFPPIAVLQCKYLDIVLNATQQDLIVNPF